MANDRITRDGASIDWSFAPYLPPKSPSFHGAGSSISDSISCGGFFSTWPAFENGSTRRHHQRTPSTSFLPQTPAWIDDLLDDPADVPPTKGLHRRSSSDSVAFLDAPLQYDRIDDIAEEEEDADNSKQSKHMGPFDEEQLQFKFAGIGPFQKSLNSYLIASKHNTLASDRRAALENLSVPADHPRPHQKSEHEVQGASKGGEEPPVLKGESSFDAADPSLDPKRAKRILANRQSAQRSRVRKLQYISELERSVTILQEEVSLLSPQVACLDHHRIILNVDNSSMKQRLAALAQEKLFKDAQNEALNKEVQRLTRIFQQQQQRQIQQHPLNNATAQQQLNHLLPTLQQADARDYDISSSNVAKCIDALFKDSEAELPRSHMPPPRSPLVKPIGPPSSSCSTGEKGRGLLNMSGTLFQHSVHNQ